MNPTYGTNLAKAASSKPNLGGSPNGDSAQIQNLQNLAAIGMRAMNTDNNMNAFGGAAQNAADIEAANRSAAAAQADADARKKVIQDKAKEAMSDPANYIKKVSADGGYNFFKPDGTPISVLEYSQVTGKQIPDILSGSNSTQDAQFKSDYDSLKLYGAAMAGDEDARKSFADSKAGKAFLADPANKNKTYAEIVSEFKNHFSGYLQPQQTDTMQATDTSGKDVRNSVMGGTGAGVLSDWLNGRRQNVNYL